MAEPERAIEELAISADGLLVLPAAFRYQSGRK
jgi:hypothetical protein